MWFNNISKEELEKLQSHYKKNNEKYPDVIEGHEIMEKTYELNKDKPRYKAITAKENHSTYIIDQNNRKIHKRIIHSKSFQ